MQFAKHESSQQQLDSVTNAADHVSLRNNESVNSSNLNTDSLYCCRRSMLFVASSVLCNYWFIGSLFPTGKVDASETKVFFWAFQDVMLLTIMRFDRGKLAIEYIYILKRGFKKVTDE